MKFLVAIACLLLLFACGNNSAIPYQGLDDRLIHAAKDTVIKERLYLNRDSTLSYHNVRLDQDGGILPWYSADLGESYDKVINLVWEFWDKMELDSNGIKYYLNHQVWRPGDDKRGLGGDQLMMALSSWDLLYNYNGNKAIKDNMKFMADYYLSHSLSGPNDLWPDLPYPYNTVLHSGVYDGDMILGKGFLQPDKAGSFGYELVHLFKKTGDQKYLDAAVKIANTLAAKVQPGDEFHSPWPFKVNATTGEAGKLINKPNINKPEPGTTYRDVQESVYTTNWTATLALFNELKALGKGDAATYTRAHDMALDWLKKYPAKNNKWGPFFEDILGWSDCQINAITYAMYLMDNEQVDPDWKNTVKNIFQWVRTALDDKEFEKYGVITTDEQTIYRTPGNSHSSRQASMELRYWEKTGDTTRLTNAIRQLNWATYMVNTDGRNYYIRDDIWLTDGYGDYVRHYIRAMAAAPQLAHAKGDHLLRTSSVVSAINYNDAGILYTTFDAASQERFHVQAKPKKISVDGTDLEEVADSRRAGFTWQPIGRQGAGVLSINKDGREVKIIR
ncbi:hypothetical protein [Flavihumibacter fluvii]|uniref:hypothetical protein n=1 Tax=Flavihumibacter fluvii TaxID=2838157 RepID=UPI001BDE46DC|nr:hypothetical protein [Flavihumibacter fluvii]ULQ52079.1 hypothetical protein KJS93_18460 [Flavihumibacter fluvii]